MLTRDGLIKTSGILIKQSRIELKPLVWGEIISNSAVLKKLSEINFYMRLLNFIFGVT